MQTVNTLICFENYVDYRSSGRRLLVFSQSQATILPITDLDGYSSSAFTTCQQKH